MLRAPALALALLLALPLASLAQPQGTQRVAVQFDPPPDAPQRAGLAAHGVRTFVGILPAAIGDVGPADLAWLRAQPFVERVDPDEPLVFADTLSAPLIRAGGPTLDLGYDGSGIGVAVLDSGIDASHPDFQGRIADDVTYVNGNWLPTQVDTDGHGTHVSGIVGGSGAASHGAIQGVAPGARLVGMDFTRAFTTTTALQAFDWVLAHKAQYNIRVVQNSWGRAESEPWDPGDPLVRASDRLVGEGMVVVFSAGNKGPGAGTLSLESQNPRVITVGAVDAAALPAGFSGRGPVRDAQGNLMDWVKPDVVADGVGVVSTRSAEATGTIQAPVLQPSQLPIPGLPGGPALDQQAARYIELSGTSQAAPHVAGLAAVMLQANPALTPGQVHNLLRETAIDLGARGPDNETGFGLVDARDAVRAALGLAPDRGNVLLAGGEESFQSAGTLSSAQGQMIQTSPYVQVKSEGVAEQDFPVKPGAASVRFDFAWTPVTTGFRIYLAGPSETLGPWTSSDLADGGRVIHGTSPDPPAGMYRLVARPNAGAEVQFQATVTVSLHQAAALPAELAAKYRAPEQQGPLEQVRDEVQYEIDRVRRAVPGPEPALAALAVAALALALPLRRRP